MNKVEITGVNTSKLTTLTNKEMNELLLKVKNGDMEARNKMIVGNLKLVLSVMKKFNNRKDTADDLFQVGAIGLMKAIDNFDLGHNVRFSTYAVPMIIGEIRRYLRDNSSIRVSRSLKDIAYKALQYKEQYILDNQKEPSIEEIAKGIEEDKIDVVIALEAIQDPVSIYTPIYNNGTDEICLIDQISDINNSEDKKVLELTIEKGIKKLNEREKNIIKNRFFLGKTQMEIAEEIGISQAQVSRLEKNALKLIFESE